MPRDEWFSQAAFREEIVTKHFLQVQQCVFRLVLFRPAKAVHSFEAVDVVFPLQEFHPTVLP
ncbi:MAG TPA: hypothetical protein VKM93_28455 [Terriglobia bacterium]|nr:hypothetical protein [Terriglobia bacterium]